MSSNGTKSKKISDESEVNGCYPAEMEQAFCDKRYDTNAVKEWLNDFREREKDIQSQLQRLDVMETRLSSIGSPTLSNMPKSASPVQDRMASMVAVKVDLENDIKRQQKGLLETREMIEKILLKALKKSEERSVIRARYLDCCFYHEDKLSDWNDVNNTMFGDRQDFLSKEESYLRRVHKIHGSALLNMARYIEDNNIKIEGDL